LEHSVNLQLQNKQYESFLPTYKVRRRGYDRIRETDLPLFPSYLFCRFPVLKRLPVLTTPGVMGIVGAGNEPVPVNDEEIAALQRIVKLNLRADPCKYYSVGQRVRIDEGALRGIEGIITGFAGHQRLIISVSLLQRSVAVELDAAALFRATLPPLAGALVLPEHSEP
jgi:transcription antitermination factor NusG